MVSDAFDLAIKMMLKVNGDRGKDRAFITDTNSFLILCFQHAKMFSLMLRQ